MCSRFFATLILCLCVTRLAPDWANAAAKANAAAPTKPAQQRREQRGARREEQPHDAAGRRDVPRTHTTPDGYALGSWQGMQRTARKRGKLSAERAERLEAVGFVWDARGGAKGRE